MCSFSVKVKTIKQLTIDKKYVIINVLYITRQVNNLGNDVIRTNSQITLSAWIQSKPN